MPNWFAYFILLLWPVICWRWYMSKPALTATVYTILGGYMFLPVRVAMDLPLIPPLDKGSIASLAAWVGIFHVAKPRFRLLSFNRYLKWLLILLVAGTFITSFLNDDPVYIEGRPVVMGAYDAVSAVIGQLISILPFICGYHVCRTGDQHRELMILIVKAGLLYSIFVLFEIKMSPQLHTWIYGFFPHSFAQQARAGGFRAVVFMGHGLAVAFFMSITVMAAAVMKKVSVIADKSKSTKVLIYLIVVLVLSKSLGPLLYGLIAISLIYYSSANIRRRVFMALACIAIMYPVLCLMDVFPHKGVLDAFSGISEERADSLKFRFDSEKALLSRAREKIWFGWGTWGRNRIYDVETGVDQSITDGAWIVVLGQFGLVGFVAFYGIVFFVIYQASSVLKKLKNKSEGLLIATHAIMLSFVFIDQIPNSSLTAFYWFLLGTLLGRCSFAQVRSIG